MTINENIMLKSAFNATHIGIILYSTDYEIININPMLCNILGYSEDEADSIKIRNLLYKYHDMPNHFNALNKLRDGEIKVYETEMAFYKKNGEVIWTLTKTSFVNDNLSYFVSVIEDITEAKKNRNLVKNTTDTSVALISVTDKNLNYIYMNKSYEDFFNIKREIFLGKHVTEVIEPKVYKKALPYVMKALSGETCKFDNYTKSADGKDKVMETTFKPYYVTGEISGVVTYIFDITERKALEDKLKELNATKDKFLSIIAHDLRNSFGGFLGFTEILKDEIDSLTGEELSNISKLMNDSAKTTYKLLENLLEWSLLQKQQINFKLELVKFDEVIAEIFNEVRDNADKKNIKLAKSCTDDCEFVADKNMIKSIIRNLITNAIKFTPKNGMIKLDIKPKDTSYVMSVSDTGVGMSENIISNLFKIDNKHTSRGTEDEPGTGLGLLLCKEFVDKHNGKIWCESVINKGTTFFVEIPQLSAN